MFHLFALFEDDILDETDQYVDVHQKWVQFQCSNSTTALAPIEVYTLYISYHLILYLVSVSKSNCKTQEDCHQDPPEGLQFLINNEQVQTHLESAS